MSGWRYWRDPDGTMRLEVRLDEDDARRMDREQLEMLADAAWLVEASFRGKTTGPLTLPATGLPVRI